MFSPSLQNTNHEVHVYGLPLQSWNVNNLSETTSLKVLCLNLITIQTLCHILSKVLLHAIQPMDLLEVMIHLGGTWMYRIPGTMGLCSNLSPQIIHITYTQPVLVPKYVVTSQSKELIHLYQP